MIMLQIFPAKKDYRALKLLKGLANLKNLVNGSLSPDATGASAVKLG